MHSFNECIRPLSPELMQSSREDCTHDTRKYHQALTRSVASRKRQPTRVAKSRHVSTYFKFHTCIFVTISIFKYKNMS